MSVRVKPHLICKSVCKSRGDMARFVGKLSALAVNKAKKKGFYADGGCLYLQVKDSGAKSWL